MRTLLSWLPLAAVTTLICGLMYVVVQQDVRQGANEPQNAIAEDRAARSASGAEPIACPTIDLAHTLLPFVQIYGPDGGLRSSQAVLDGRSVVVPRGVLAFARAHGEHAVTWQPRPGVREALVIIPFSGQKSGFVVAGRSLRDVERRETRLLRMIVVAWFAAMAAALILMLLRDLAVGPEHPAARA